MSTTIIARREVVEPHEFEASKTKSHSAADSPIWKECYEKFFPSMVAMTDHRKNGYWQHLGIDRSVILDTSKQIKIDEKARFPNPKTNKSYDDIALEYLSNDRMGTPGWVCKPLQCDYIAYAILQLGKCYLLPVQQLQSAWVIHGEEWKEQYYNIEAKNPNYSSWSVAVPPHILFPAMADALRCDFTPVVFPAKQS